MARRKPPEVNSSSMADIAFMLLIFFLVATTMDIDSGILRKLPPMPEEEQENDDKIKERNLFIVLINKNDQLLVEGEPLGIDYLKDKTKEFVANPRNLANLPEKKLTRVDYFGEYQVSKGIISLQNDNGTSYGMYINVQNALAQAYNELRDELALNKFGRRYNELIGDKMKAVKKIYPQRISEAEPKNVGGD